MLQTKTIFIAAIIAASSVAAAEPIIVLGLPIAGKIKAPNRQCKMDEIGTQVKSACWVSKPYTYKDMKSGGALLPGRENLPVWAEHASLDITVRKDGTLEEFEVRTFNVSDWAKMHDAVTARFGRPNDSSKGLISTASWVRPEIYVDLRCHSDSCRLKFLSRRAYDNWQQELEDRKKKDAQRPTSV